VIAIESEIGSPKERENEGEGKLSKKPVEEGRGERERD